jgi:LPS-assembly protein
MLAGVLCVGAAETNAPALEPGAVDVKADQLIYDRDTGWIEGRGNVVVVNGEDTLTADHVRVNMQTEKAEAFGHVVLTGPDGVTRSEHLSYDLKEQVGQADNISGLAKPFYWVSDSAERVSTNTYVLHKAEVTTCRLEGKHRHFHVRAKEMTVVPGEWMKARHATWYFGRIPSFYMPYWFRSLQESGCGWSFQPGYHSRMGAYLLSTYRCAMTPWLKTETHLDYRTARGPAIGQDFRWHQPGTAWSGDLEMYYLDDKRPVDSDEDAATADIDNNRHRIRLRHRYEPSTHNYALLQAYHLSDTDVQEDFFGREYSRGAQPENYFIYTHRDDGYLASLQVRKQLNDFYTTMERLPELSADVFRQEIGDSRFYYEGLASLGYLQQTWAEDSTTADYSSLRGDIYQRIYRPYKLFGFLNMVPRAGYRGTWYSETADLGSGDESDMRSLFDLGQEMSFKAFRVWNGSGASHAAYRHIVEPYADYKYVINDGLEPGENLQFDNIDTLGSEHWVQVGLRNKLQTKRGDRAKDLVDLNVFSYYDLDPDPGVDAIDNINFDLEAFPFAWMRLDVDGHYSLAQDILEEFNTRLWVWKNKAWSAGIEQRYWKDESSLWSAKLNWKPSAQWAFGSHVRYEAEESRLEEYGGYAQRRYDCLAWRTGVDIMPAYTRTDGTQREDEWRVMIEFWLTDFPSSRMRIK